MRHPSFRLPRELAHLDIILLLGVFLMPPRRLIFRDKAYHQKISGSAPENMTSLADSCKILATINALQGHRASDRDCPRMSETEDGAPDQVARSSAAENERKPGYDDFKS